MKAVISIAAAAGATLLIGCSGGQPENIATRAGGVSTDRLETASAAKSQGFGTTSASGIASIVEERDMSASPPARALPDAPANASPQTTSGGVIDSPAASQITPTMVIRNGQASLEVEKLDPAIVKLRQLATQLGGYIANSSMVGGRDQVRSATLELKIPAQRFDQAVNGLGNIGKVESVNATAEDVGEEFVDITARVTNARRLEERLINLLATRAGKLEDVLAVERELARVREEIERYEGRLRFLKSRVATSSLSVSLHEPLPILGQSPGQNPIVAAIRQAWRNFVGFIAAGIASLGVIIPLGVLVVAGWLVYKRIRRKNAKES